ncbi:MAG: bifunctional transaldolase/phosoglucose isomerase [Syntrophales bacterium]
MKTNPILKLSTLGQSIWLDFLRRNLISSGELRKLIEEDGLRGVTSNPTIFEKAIAGSHDYDDDIRVLALEGKTEDEIYTRLSVEDIQNACDQFRPVYDGTDGKDGFVSLEVSPHLARDTAGTIADARRLRAAVDRPNVMIKIPATIEGLPAIRQLISEGVNVNITLLFGLPRYRDVVEAYLCGLEDRLGRGGSLERLASVASFFLSRIDVLVDPLLEKVIAAGGPESELASRCRGRTAIASAKIAYQIYKEIFGSARFRRLEEQGACRQRLLWASTGTKNPAYSDTMYVEPLIGPETVNTVPLETLNAYRDHGNPEPRLEDTVSEARDIIASLARLGIDIDKVTQQLEDEGIRKFNEPFDRLMESIKKRRDAALGQPADRETLALGSERESFQARMKVLEENQFGIRLWRKDAAVWKRDPALQPSIRNGLGWLHSAEKMEENLRELDVFAGEVKSAGLHRVLHLGMGGSSLAPLVFRRTFAGARGIPLDVLDSTDPATILKVEKKSPIEKTLFIVASKSGTTAEPLALKEYFFSKLTSARNGRGGENFAAITDPGTPLADLAARRSFRRIFLNFPDIGGRYSALSYFGIVPAALMGADIPELLARALRMVHACAPSVPIRDNPGISLGAAIGESVRRGRDKITFIMPDQISSLGMWLEQLLAESTGKEGTGVLPVDGEPVGPPVIYGKDRLFIYFRLRTAENAEHEQAVDALCKAGFPVITIHMEDILDLAQEFFRWEVATATAGAVLGVNPFDQPNVQESKDNTNRLLAQFKKTGGMPEKEPTLADGDLLLYASQQARTAAGALAYFFSLHRPGDYVALQAYLEETHTINEALQEIRINIRDRLLCATTLGYGPRFLHSTGQFHKGGPNTGLFIQLTADDGIDVPIPGQPYTFGMFKRAQALGDFQALERHGRRVMRVHLGMDALSGLSQFREILFKALDIEK